MEWELFTYGVHFTCDLCKKDKIYGVQYALPGINKVVCAECAEKGVEKCLEELNNGKEEREEMQEDTDMETVHIRRIFNGITYEGDVTIDDDNNVDLSVFENNPELKDRMSNWVSTEGYSIARVRNMLTWEALYMADRSDEIHECYETGWHLHEDYLTYCRDDEYRCSELCTEWNGDYYATSDCTEHRIRRGDGDIDYETAPESYWEDLSYCDDCECYIEYDDDYYGNGQCAYCHREQEHGIIDDYCESHEREVIFFGDYKGEFQGLGFELEVDCDCSTARHNTETASGLCDACGLKDDEMRYAHDGSLNNGFEIISQPHTVKDFWEKTEKWKKMLSYLADKGYKSHDPGTCGLHVHVSREMFGKTRAEQDRAISKIYSFFDDNWDDIVKVSRRRSFTYCEKNECSNPDGDNTYMKWRKHIRSAYGHHVALNNGNDTTFEYRLGRGTLNSWSFFSWIDLVITLTKNAKRITVEKVVSNDLLSWLGGIKESTAKYIYKRGAWKREMVALFPNIEWETDLVESSTNNN